jgi:hypothetical protein
MSVIVVEWDRHRAAAAIGEIKSGHVQLSSARELSWAEDGDSPVSVKERLRSLLSEITIRPQDSVILVLPRQLVTIHRIQLPLAPDAEIPDMVRLQGSMRLTVPIDSVSLDYAPLPAVPGATTRDVLMTSILRDDLNALTNAFASLQLQVTHVRVSSLAISGLLAGKDCLPPTTTERDGIQAVALLRRELIEILLLRNGHVLFSSGGGSLPEASSVDESTSEDPAYVQKLDQAVRGELNRARLTAADLTGNQEISAVALIGSPELTSKVSDRFAGRSGPSKIIRIHPEQLLRTSETSVDAISLISMASAVFAESQSVVPQVDLINPRRAPKVPDRRRAKVLAGVLAALVIFASLFTWRQNKIRTLTDETADLTSAADEIRTAMQLGEADLNAATLISDWVQRDISWLGELQKIRELLPGTDRLIVRGFQFAVREGTAGTGTIRMDGKARTADDIELLARKFVEAGYLVDPFKPQTSPRDPEYPVEVTLQLTIPLNSSSEGYKDDAAPKAADASGVPGGPGSTAPGEIAG